MKRKLNKNVNIPNATGGNGSDDSNELVTKGYLRDVFKVELKNEIITEVRIMLHQALLESFENAKIYHQRETDRYIGAMMEQHRDEMRVYSDQFKSMMQRIENHEKRIGVLERVG